MTGTKGVVHVRIGVSSQSLLQKPVVLFLPVKAKILQQADTTIFCRELHHFLSITQSSPKRTPIPRAWKDVRQWSERKFMTLMGFFIVSSLLHESGASHVRDQMALHLARATALMVGRAPRIRESSITPLLVMGTEVDADQNVLGLGIRHVGAVVPSLEVSRTSKTLRLRVPVGIGHAVHLYDFFF
jgi:hypothetical protein